MAKLIVAVAKVLLVLVVVAAIGVGALWLAQREGWPQWSALVAMLIALALIMLVALVRRYYFRRREKAFVKRVVDQDRAVIDALPAKERQRFLELRERWTAAVATLRASPRLRKGGNPLYSLPWFMVLGESGSGKSSAIAGSALPTILTDAGPAKGIGGTRNCDWWFFEDSVVLDTAGRYVVSSDEEDRLEWEGFLTLLAKYRRKEPLNGLILSLPADKILANDEEALAEYGRSLRRRTDQLMRVLGTRFPIYLLVTKADLVFGMVGLGDLLPRDLLSQPLGVLNDAPKESPERFAAFAVERIVERLKECRFGFCCDGQPEAVQAALLPDEIERLEPRIKTFVAAAFHETPYLETPFLRGLFVSSARRSGSSRSLVLQNAASLGDSAWQLGDGKLGLFLHDLFATILPRDRRAFRRIREYRRWLGTTLGLAMATWCLLVMGGAGYALLSYLHVRSALDPATEALASQKDLGSSLTADMEQLVTLRSDILATQRALDQGVFANILFPQGNLAVVGFKKRFVEAFRENILAPTDRRMSERYWSYEVGQKRESLAPYIEYLIWRVQVIEERDTKPGTTSFPSTDPVEVLATAFSGRLPYVLGSFPEMYRSYVRWETNQAILDSEEEEMKVIAARLINSEAPDLHWLVGWVQSKIALEDVTLDDFWQGLGEPDAGVRVLAAYTSDGKARIEGFLEQLKRVVPVDASLQARIDAFWRWYAGEYDAAWDHFARNFSAGFRVLLTQRDWLNAAATMPTLNNPYFKLMDRMRQELKAIASIGGPYPLPGQLASFKDAVLAYQGGQKGAKLGELIRGTAAKVDARLPGSQDATAAAKDLSKYLENLGQIAQATNSLDAAFRLASENFGALPNGKNASPPEVAAATANQIISQIAHENDDVQVFSELLEGPLFFLVNLITNDAACAMNQLWSTQVVGDAAGLPDYQLWEHLFGQKGTVKAFTSGPAKPFVTQTSAGWQADSWQGVRFPFTDDFLAFIAQGQVRREQPRSSYHVTINALPTNVNRDAKSEPFQTRLVLSCGGKTQVLNNFNFPNFLSFSWGPRDCGEVSLSIYFPETTVVHSWDGAEGFLQFLREFKDGNVRFTPDQFPAQQSILQGLNVSSIQVNYAIKNAGPIMQVVRYPKLTIPAAAARCGSAFQPANISSGGSIRPASSGLSTGEDSSLGSEP